MGVPLSMHSSRGFTLGRERMLSSQPVVPGRGSPVTFYEHYGFVWTGEIFEDEIVLKLDLRSRVVDESTDASPAYETPAP